MAPGRRRWWWLTAGIAGFALVAMVGAHARDVPKQTVLVPMSDKVRLATDVYLPAGSGKSFPVVVIRTPYDKNGMASAGQVGAQNGYVVVIQDTRGRFGSEGENLPFVGDGWAEHRDGYDTLEWVAAQPWCNGKIGTLGGSAVGITQLGEAGAGSTRITCQHISVAAPSFYPYLVFPGGIFKKSLVEDWVKSTHHSADSVAWWTKHSDYDDFWKQRDLTHRWEKVNSPAIHIGGWYDIFSQGTIDTFNGYQTQGGPKARGTQKLVMGPWTHGISQDKAGELNFPDGATPPNNVQDMGAWFEAYLKGRDTGVQRQPAVTYYVMGDVTDKSAPGNIWRTADAWPPVKATDVPYYLRTDRTISTDQPASGTPLTYAYDPQNPAPTIGGPQLTIPSGPMEQSRVEARPDVLVFSSPILARPLEVTGRVQARLWVSSDAPDTDFFVKLCDVYPDGRSINICEGQLRARFRDGFDKEHLLQPGKVYPLTVDLWSTSMIFNKGHRLRVQVTSSSAPGYDPNPNTGAAFRADTRTRVAHNTLFLSGEHASYVSLPTVPAAP